MTVIVFFFFSFLNIFQFSPRCSFFFHFRSQEWPTCWQVLAVHEQADVSHTVHNHKAVTLTSHTTQVSFLTCSRPNIHSVTLCVFNPSMKLCINRLKWLKNYVFDFYIDIHIQKPWGVPRVACDDVFITHAISRHFTSSLIIKSGYNNLIARLVWTA